MTAGRVHVRGNTGQVNANLIVTWPPGTPVADVEEAIKQAARDAIRRARTTTRERQ